jgi:Fe-S cluster assembly protein SufD
MTVIKPEAAPYIAAYRAGVDTAEPDWLRARREAAIEQFATLGFPTRNDEAWRFTNLRPLAGAALPLAAASLPNPAIDGIALGVPTYRLVLHNGIPVPALSSTQALPAGVWFGTVAEVLNVRPELLKSAFVSSDFAGNQPFAALNAAMFRGGFVLTLEPGVKLEAPVEIIHFNSGTATHTRCAILVGEGASATVVEMFSGVGAGWSNVVAQVELGDGANLRHIKIQSEAAESIHLSVTRAVLASAATYSDLILSLGGRLTREDIHVALSGQGADYTLNAANLLRDQQETTFAPFVEHQVAGCTSRQTVKAVVAERAHGVFLGTIAVHPGADQTDAKQTNRNLLLDAGATVDTRPELEIYADDVKCSHGATVGDLDDAAFFYLQARGIDPHTARQMLVEAFAADIIDTANVSEDLSAYLHNHLSTWLGGLG